MQIYSPLHVVKSSDAKRQLAKQISFPVSSDRTTKASLVRQKSRRGSFVSQNKSRNSGQASQLKRKLSRKLDISFDKLILDTSAFPFQFLNTIVSVAVTEW